MNDFKYQQETKEKKKPNPGEILSSVNATFKVFDTLHEPKTDKNL
jgi:hypothetical protein